MPAIIFAGRLVVSRSGTLTYEIVDELTRAGMGQTTCVGIGGDPIIGSSFVDVLGWFEKTATKAVALSGEIGGNDEEMAADFIKNHMSKPVVAFIAKRRHPESKWTRGRDCFGSAGSAASKVEAFQSECSCR
jgi:succinyl-CoA synthetase alpha subunit